MDPGLPRAARDCISDSGYMADSRLVGGAADTVAGHNLTGPSWETVRGAWSGRHDISQAASS